MAFFFFLLEARFGLHAVPEPPVVALWQTDATAASADVTWLLLLLLWLLIHTFFL